jgi:hypothetical protein
MAERPMSTAVVFLFGRATEGKLKAAQSFRFYPLSERRR